MNKNLIILLISSLLISTAVAADEIECKNHPAFAKAKQLIQDVIKTETKGAQKSQLLLEIFQNTSPDTLSSEDLGVCSQYADQKSCCNKNIVKLLDKAALLKVKPLLQQKTAFQKLISVYVKSQANLKCTSTKTVSADVIFADSALTFFITQRDAHKKCKVEFAKSIAQLTRGAMCSICSGVEKISDYFDSNGMIKISSESQSAFQKAASDAIDCIAGTVSADNIGKIIDELKTNYGIGDNQCAIDLRAKVIKIFEKPKVEKDDGNGNMKCNGKQVFSAKADCENSIQGDSNLENVSRRLLKFERENVNRILASSDDASVVSSGGVNINVVSSLDSQADDSGSFSVDFDDVDETNNSLKLGFGVLLILTGLLL